MPNTVSIQVGEIVFNEVDAAIITLNEEDKICNVLDNIYNYVDGIVIIDGGSTDRTIEQIKMFHDPDQKIKLYKNKFTSFGDQKNLAISKTNSLWTLVIDADERLSTDLLLDLRSLLRANKEKDIIIFDRRNYVDGVPEEKAVEKQYRLFKSFCRYVSIVHEELVGWRHELSVELAEKYYIYHNKSKEKFNQNQIDFTFLQAQNPHKDCSFSRLIKYDIEE